MWNNTFYRQGKKRSIESYKYFMTLLFSSLQKTVASFLVGKEVNFVND